MIFNWAAVAALFFIHGLFTESSHIKNHDEQRVSSNDIYTNHGHLRHHSGHRSGFALGEDRRGPPRQSHHKRGLYHKIHNLALRPGPRVEVSTWPLPRPQVGRLQCVDTGCTEMGGICQEVGEYPHRGIPKTFYDASDLVVKPAKHALDHSLCAQRSTPPGLPLPGYPLKTYCACIPLNMTESGEIISIEKPAEMLVTYSKTIAMTMKDGGKSIFDQIKAKCKCRIKHLPEIAVYVLRYKDKNHPPVEDFKNISGVVSATADEDKVTEIFEDYHGRRRQHGPSNTRPRPRPTKTTDYSDGSDYSDDTEKYNRTSSEEGYSKDKEKYNDTKTDSDLILDDNGKPPESVNTTTDKPRDPDDENNEDMKTDEGSVGGDADIEISLDADEGSGAENETTAEGILPPKPPGSTSSPLEDVKDDENPDTETTDGGHNSGQEEDIADEGSTAAAENQTPVYDVLPPKQLEGTTSEGENPKAPGNTNPLDNVKNGENPDKLTDEGGPTLDPKEDTGAMAENGQPAQDNDPPVQTGSVKAFRQLHDSKSPEGDKKYRLLYNIETKEWLTSDKRRDKQ